MSRQITGKAMVAGVTGWPVAHSLSPRLHGYWLDHYGIDGAYLPFPIQPEDFTAAVRGLKAAGVRGLNVTVPHKRAAYELADDLDDAARLIGAVNTLIFHPDGRTEGRNTDAPGFLANLLQHDVRPEVGPVMLFGAGGSARAAVHALLQAGAPEIRLFNRSHTRAEDLVRDVGDTRLHYCGETPEIKDFSDIALLVNTTSLGMANKGALPIDLSGLPSSAVVHDIVYTPLLTPLLSQAVGLDLKAVDGLGMLLHQATPAFEAFFGVLPKVDQGLRDHLLEVL